MTWGRILSGFVLAGSLTILFNYFLTNHVNTRAILDRYVAGGQIATGLKDNGVEQAASSNKIKLLVGYALYNQLYEFVHNREHHPSFGGIATDEKYDPDRMNVVFVSPLNDPENLLGRLDVQTAKNVGNNLVIVNKEFIDNVAHTEIVTLDDYKSKRYMLQQASNSESYDLSRSQLSEAYGLTFVSYVILHEIAKSILIADSPNELDRDQEVDRSIVALLVELASESELMQKGTDYGLEIYQLVNDSLAAYGSYLLKDNKFKTTDGKHDVREFLLVRQPSLWRHICNFFDELSVISLEAKFSKEQAEEYREICRHTDIARTVWR